MNHYIDTSKTSFLKKKMEAYTFRALKTSKQIFCPWLSRFKKVHSMDQKKIITGTHLYNNLFNSQNNKDILL